MFGIETFMGQVGAEGTGAPLPRRSCRAHAAQVWVAGGVLGTGVVHSDVWRSEDGAHVHGAAVLCRSRPACMLLRRRELDAHSGGAVQGSV